MDEYRELLAEVERELRVALPERGVAPNAEPVPGIVSEGRAPSAVKRALIAIERAKVIKGLRW